MKRLKVQQVPVARRLLLAKQKNKCAVCGCDFDDATYNKKKRKVVLKYRACLDHNHTTGYIRGVLCDGCNGLEGKVARFLQRHPPSCSVPEVLRGLAEYLERHATPRTEWKHHSFRTDSEKREARNKRRRRLRKEAQALRDLNE